MNEQLSFRPKHGFVFNDRAGVILLALAFISLAIRNMWFIGVVFGLLGISEFLAPFHTAHQDMHCLKHNNGSNWRWWRIVLSFVSKWTAAIGCAIVVLATFKIISVAEWTAPAFFSVTFASLTVIAIGIVVADLAEATRKPSLALSLALLGVAVLTLGVVVSCLLLPGAGVAAVSAGTMFSMHVAPVLLAATGAVWFGFLLGQVSAK